MGDKSKIPWCDATINPVIGCSHASPGCDHCYAERMANRLASNPSTPQYHGLTEGGKWTGETRFVESQLELPLRWKRPRRIFVCSMGDLFHESVPFEWIDSVFGMMWACEFLGRNAVPGHTFMVLTKRVYRMAEYLGQDRRGQWAHNAVTYGGGIDPDGIHDQVFYAKYPHPRIWLGATIENEEQAIERIPQLLSIKNVKRFLSCEPLLSRTSLYSCLGRVDTHKPKIHWLVAGGESGPGARPMHPEWVRLLRDQCQATDVPFMLKQNGEWCPECLCGISRPGKASPCPIAPIQAPLGTHRQGVMYRCGKKATGRMLDGRDWLEVPR